MRRLQRGKTARTHARRRSEKLTLLSCRRAEVSFKIKDHSLLVSCQQHHAEFYLLNHFSQLLMLYWQYTCPASIRAECFPRACTWSRAQEAAGSIRRCRISRPHSVQLHPPIQNAVTSSFVHSSRSCLCCQATQKKCQRLLSVRHRAVETCVSVPQTAYRLLISSRAKCVFRNAGFKGNQRVDVVFRVKMEQKYSKNQDSGVNRPWKWADN